MKKITIKHLTLALLLIISAGGLIFQLSRAFYQDQETAYPSISMGVLNLQVGEEDPANVPLDFTGMMPEEVRTYSFDVKNIGQVEGNLWLQTFITDEGEGENLEPEPETFFDGDISQCARMSFSLSDVEGNDILLIDNQLITFVHQQTYETAHRSIIDEAVNADGSTARITVDTYSCGNETMGDELEMSLVFYLTQAGD